MSRCRYYKICRRESDEIPPDGGSCVLHSESSDKDLQEFREVLEEHRERVGSNFQFMVFPVGISPFRGATFERGADFFEATFEGRANFFEATFEGEAGFSRTTFEGAVGFNRATFEGEADFAGSFVQKADREESSAKVDFGHSRMVGKVVFAGYNEKERAFGNRSISFANVERGPESQLCFRYADLSHCRFLRTDLRQIDFDGVKWCEGVAEGEWFSRAGVYDEIHEAKSEKTGKANAQESAGRRWYEVERLYRQLKKNYEDRGDHPRAGDFHIGEKEVRRKNPETKWGPRFLLAVYRGISKYGERALPAFLWLLVIVLGCAFAYLLMGVSPSGTEAPLDARRGADWARALIYSTRVSTLTGDTGGLTNLWGQALQVLQSIASPVLIALFALALRRQVKR